MAKALSSYIQNRINRKDLKVKFVFKINDVDYSDYLISYTINFDKEFGSASASFNLNNSSGDFGESGATPIKIGDVVSLSEYFANDTNTEFKKFYGLVNQRAITKEATNRTISLSCLDYISSLQYLDIDLVCEGTKVKVENEVLTPNYLPSPNDSLAQIFDFANSSIADKPLPLIVIRDKNHLTDSPQWDGFEIIYDTGQLKLGSPLNALYNYDVVSSLYYFYTKGKYIEDILEEIITQVDGYCYSSDTEVLTENGWMLLKDIVENKMKIKIATLNPEKNVVEYHYPNDYIKQKYNGIMLHQEGKRIDLKVTPNHNIWAKQISSWTNYDYKFYKAYELPKHVLFKKDFQYEGIEKEYFTIPEYNSCFSKIDYRTKKVSIYHIKKPEIKIKMDSWLRFFGVFIAEGWVNKDCKDGKYSIVKISQYPSWKKDIIDKWLKETGFKYTYNLEAKEFTICNVQLAQYLQQFGDSFNKYIPRELLNLSKRQLTILLKSMCLGDGTIKEHKEDEYSFAMYSTVSNNLANDFQELALKCGFTPTLSKEEVINRISLAIRPESMPNQGVDNRNWELYDGDIYCLNIKNHLLYVRRNGKCCWCGNSGYLFGESSAANVITNHLIETFSNVEGTSVDYLVPNYKQSEITIETTLTVAYEADSSFNTQLTVTSTSGFPDSGEITINGDTCTYTSKDTTHFYGIPTSGSYALKDHEIGSYVKYTHTYDVGQVWYLRYNHISTSLVAGNFTIPGGTFNYFDSRYGRIILTSAIATTSIVTCDIDYSFNTLQASGIEVNYIAFKPREVENRFEAIKKLRNYVAPNYLIFTQGDNKIWAKYLSQRTTEDYTLSLIQSINYLEDEDLYTRAIFYRKNKNPTNLMFNDGVDFVSTGETYKALASNNTLFFYGEEGDSYVYKSVISNAGYIDLEDIIPIVYINGYPIDNTLHQISATPCVLEITTRTETKSGCHGISKEGYTKIHTYYYYDIYLAHPSIEPSKPIYFYDAFGTLVLTVAAYDTNMDYAKGIYNAPGEEQNTVLESISTASYTIFYSTGDLVIDYDNVIFKVKKNLIGSVPKTIVSATYEYWTVMTPVKDVASIIDGRWDTQVQTEFFAEPPTDYNYAILDLGAEYNVQAIDIVAGFFKPDNIRKYDINFNFTLQYSTDNINYYNISDNTYNKNLSGGGSVSFEENDLGTDFSARYLKIMLTNVDKIDYGSDSLVVNTDNYQHLLDEGYITSSTNIGETITIREGLWAVAFTELSAYDNIVIKSNATLISTTYLSAEIDLDGLSSNEYPTTITVDDTTGFTDPESGETSTAYIDNGDGTFDAFTYTGLTATSFTGVDNLGVSHDNDAMVVQSLEDDDTVYDYKGLRVTTGDRIYKDIQIDDSLLMTKTQVDYLAKQYLLEFVKDHTKLEVTLLACPYINVGHTVKLVDSYNNIDHNYFVESVTSNNGISYELVLAYYPNA